MDICAFLRKHSIDFLRFDHPAVFTCEESAKLPKMPGADTKNLFLKAEKDERYFLVSVPHDKRVDLKALAPLLSERRLTFGSAERLKEYLGVDPGSVTILGLIHDKDHRVTFVIDERIWRADRIQSHPLTNTATLVIPIDGLKKFLSLTGHEARVMDVPGK